MGNSDFFLLTQKSEKMILMKENQNFVQDRLDKNCAYYDPKRWGNGRNG